MEVYRSIQYKILTRGFRHAIDANISAIAAMIAYSLMNGSSSAQFTHLDLAISLVLIVSGILARVPKWLIAISSIPGVLVDQALFQGGHIIAYTLVLVRIGRILWNLNWFADQADKLGKEITVLASQAGLMAGVMLFGGAISLYVIEKDAPGSMIHSFWDALWTSIVTTTTVGYGDITPVTSEGKLVASLMMIFGVGLIMFLLSELAWIIAKITAQEEIDAHLPEIDREKIKILRALEEVETLDDEEFKLIMNKLNLIRILKRARIQETSFIDDDIKVNIASSTSDKVN